MLTCPQCRQSLSPDHVVCPICNFRLQTASLRVHLNTGEVRTLTLPAHDFTIGRSAENDLVLAEEGVSRRHVCLRFTAGAYHAEDLQSKNGLFVNARRVQFHRLQDRDCLQIGPIVLHFSLVFAPWPAAALAPETQTLDSDTSAALTSGESAGEVLWQSLLQCVLHGALRWSHAQMATLWLPGPDGTAEPRLRLLAGDSQNLSAEPAVVRIGSEAEKSGLAVKILHSGGSILRESTDDTNHFREQLEVDSGLRFQLLGMPIFAGQESGGDFVPVGSAGCLPREMHNGAWRHRRPLAALILECPNEVQRMTAAEAARLQVLLAAAGRFLESTVLAVTDLRSLQATGGPAPAGPAGGHEMNHHAEVALRLHARMAPLQLPLQPRLQMACWSQPSGVIAGDYVDATAVSETEVAFAVVDVAGSGMDCAVLLYGLQACLRLQLHFESRLEKVAQRLNEFVPRAGVEAKFATMFLGVLNHQRGVLRYLNAGHTPAILAYPPAGGSRIDLLHRTGAALGVTSTPGWHEKDAMFPPGAVLVCYTDGVTEAREASGRQYGLARLTERVSTGIATAPSFSAASLLQHVRESLPQPMAVAEPAPQPDDQTILVLLAR